MSPFLRLRGRTYPPFPLSFTGSAASCILPTPLLNAARALRMRSFASVSLRFNDSISASSLSASFLALSTSADACSRAFSAAFSRSMSASCRRRSSSAFSCISCDRSRSASARSLSADLTLSSNLATMCSNRASSSSTSAFARSIMWASSPSLCDIAKAFDLPGIPIISL